MAETRINPSPKFRARHAMGWLVALTVVVSGIVHGVILVAAVYTASVCT